MAYNQKMQLFSKEKKYAESVKKMEPWSQIRVITMFMFSPEPLLKSNFLPFPEVGDNLLKSCE